MEKRRRTMDALILEDFDIVGLSEECPEQEVGVRVSHIYVQIAKIRNNPTKRIEVQILLEALNNANHKKNMSSRYVTMKINDVIRCFGNDLKTIPKSTFIQTAKLKGQC